MTDPDAAVALCAAGESAWHAAAHAGLGAPWHVDGDLAGPTYTRLGFRRVGATPLLWARV